MQRPSRFGTALYFFRVKSALVLVVAGALPVDDIAQRGCSGGARCRMLISFHVSAAGFFTNCPQTQPNFLFFGVHLDDLKVVFLSGIKLHARAGGISGFRVVAEAFNAFSDLNESAKLRQPQHLPVNDIADAMRLEEALP